ncbi:MAG: AIPR family protein [Bacteroidetes bacterium]|nr:AIPR family protein [Bacteroidota bacterium]
MKTNTSARKRNESFYLDFHSIRNISCPEDTQNNRKVFLGQCLIQSIIPLPTDENVRNYLVDADGKQKRSYTSVHKAIRETLVNASENFNVLNSGVTIVARDMIIDEKTKKIELINPSIINGAQTQGVISDYIFSIPLDTHIKCEIIITDDDDLISEISIARNFQNDVTRLSIVGKYGMFDELQKRIQKVLPEARLRKSESEFPSDDVVDTEKLLQVITALIPKELWLKKNEQEDPNKVYTYSMKARCLKDFQEMHEKAADKKDPDYEQYKNLYDFFLDIAPDAHLLYEKWKTHQAFRGSGLKCLERDGRIITDIPDGIIFPIISALSVFAEKSENHWKLNIPHDIIDQELAKTAKSVLMDFAKHNPQTMGKSKACYSSLLQISSLYKKLTSEKLFV